MQDADAADFAFDTESWANRIAAACIERYRALPRAGKPGADEWAPLAGVVAFVPCSDTRAVSAVHSVCGLPRKNLAGAESLVCDKNNAVSKAQDDLKCDLNKVSDDINKPSVISTSGHVISTGSSSSSSGSSVPSSLDLANLNSSVTVPLGSESGDVASKGMQSHKTLETLSREAATNSTPTSIADSIVSQEAVALLDPKAVHGNTIGMESNKQCIETSSRAPAGRQTPTKPHARVVAFQEGLVLQKKAMCQPPEGEVKCVALGTGSKCLGGKELGGGGNRVHDSHAEVLARRAFLRYLLHQAERALTAGDSDVLEAGPAGCRVRPGVTFHAFISEPPCGDAAIFPSDEHARRADKERPGKRRRDEDYGDTATAAKRFSRCTSEEEATAGKVQKKSIEESSNHQDSQLTRSDNSEEITIATNMELATEHKHIIKDPGVESPHPESHQPRNALQSGVHENKRALLRESGDVSADVVSPNSIPHTFHDQQIRKIATQDSSWTPPQENLIATNATTIAGAITEDSRSFKHEITKKSKQTPLHTPKGEFYNVAIAADFDDVCQKPSPTLPRLLSTLTPAPDDSSNVTANATVSDVHRTAASHAGGHSQDQLAPGIDNNVSDDATTLTAKATASDVHRTGAKCVGGGAQDRHAPGVGYHVTGAVRTKPGRGDPTLSLSCSDKMARWHAVGVQGALLSLIVPQPVRYRSVALAGGVTWSAASLRRALAERACARSAPLALAQASLRSPAGRGDGARPCAAGIVWCDVMQRPHEVVARGLKQGVTKKAASTPAGRLKICRKELAKELVRVYSLAAPRLAELRPHSNHSDEQTPGLGNEVSSLDSRRAGNAQNLGLNGDGPVVADTAAGANARLADSGVLEDRCQHLRCQSCVSDSQRDSLDYVDFCALNFDSNVCGDGVNSDKSTSCLVGDEIFVGSAAELRGFDGSIADEMESNRGQVAMNGEGVAEVVGQMTYARLKAMACDYQRRWRHVRDSHFTVWTAKPSDLKDFVVADD